MTNDQMTYAYEDFKALLLFVQHTSPGANRSHLKVTELGTPVIRTYGKPDVYLLGGERLTKKPNGEIEVE